MPKTTIQLKDFCHLFEFEDRHVRFVLEQGYVPKGVPERPATGNRREFGPGQAFWLAIVLLLKKNGTKTPVAAQIADVTSEGLRSLTQNLSWDWKFQPMKGWFHTDHQYFLDIGDLKFLRLLTDANPSHDGLYQFDWVPVKGHRPVPPDLQPFVVLRLDLGRISTVLSKVAGWGVPASQ